MIEWLMIGGIGVLTGCLLTLVFVPLVHERAVRLATRSVAEATPFNVAEMRAEKDHLRAQFAMSLRRLEVNVEEMKTKAANHLAEIGRKHAEIRDLKIELEKRAALIIALRARLQIRQSITAGIVKVLLYLFVRSSRRRQFRFFRPRPVPTMVPVVDASVVEREAA